MVDLPKGLDDNLICLFCASNSLRADGTIQLCENCGCRMQTDFLRNLHRQARDAVRFGYQYRRTYEHNFKEGRLRGEAYLLCEPPPWLVWCSLAAISGVSIISGPSKTSDIEMTLVQGVHGPNLVKVFLLS